MMNNELRVWACIGAVLAMAGCDRLQQMGSSTEDRINQAVPVASETTASKKAYDEAAKSLAVDAAALEAEFGSRLKVRALECGHGYAPSALASDDDIRAALNDKECFAKADTALQQWIGVRRIGLWLAAPPLRPIPAKPPAMLVGADTIQEVSFAERAGVALLQSAKEYRLLDLATGEAISTATVGNGEPITALSPNGRLFVGGGAGRGDAAVYESTTGALLATFPGVRSYQFYWVADVGAIYANERGADLTFIDFTTGRESKIPMTVGNLDKIVPMPGATKRYAVLAFNRHGVVEIKLGPQGWSAALISETNAASPGGWSRASGLTPDGKRLYGSAQHLNLLDLPSMKLHTVTFDPMHVQTVVATPDPDRLLVSGFFRTAPGQGAKQYLYSISQRTLAEVDGKALVSTRFLYIPTLRRNAVIDRSKIVVVDAIAASAPVPINEELERRAAELEAVARARAAEQAPLPTDSDAVRAALIARMVREGSGSAAIMAQLAMRPAAPTSAKALYPGPVGALARNADIQGLGVYEGGEVGRTRGASARTGTVQVRVSRGSRPVILVLSAYEPVRWVITVAPGAKLAAVLTSSYSPAEVIGAGNARIYNIGQHYAYKRSGENFASLDAETARWTGKRIGVFQGAYTGSAFSVGN